jgi:hypothetical protein
MCKGGQNRIDYIVYHKPFDAARLLEKHGYEAPQKAEDLARAVRHLVKRKGEIAIKELIQFHPEKKLILELTGHNSEESSYCGCNSSYSSYAGELKDQLAKIPGMTISELSELYEQAKKKAKDSPADNILMLQVEQVWEELKRRRKQSETENEKKKNSSENFYLYMGLAFCIGIVIAKIA